MSVNRDNNGRKTRNSNKVDNLNNERVPTVRQPSGNVDTFLVRSDTRGTEESNRMDDTPTSSVTLTGGTMDTGTTLHDLGSITIGPTISHAGSQVSPRPRLSTVEESDDYNRTPLGRGINHQLESIKSPTLILPAQPTQTHIESCFRGLEERIRHYINTFTSNIGWRGEFETKASTFEHELEEIKDRCQLMGYLEAYEKAILLSKDLTDHVDELRKNTNSTELTVVSTTESFLSQQPRSLDSGSYTPTQADLGAVELSSHNVSLSSDDVGPKEADSESEEYRKNQFQSRDSTPSIKRSLRNFRTRFHAFELELKKTMEKVNDKTIEKKLEEVEQEKADRHQLENLAKRISSQEEESKNANALIQTQLSELMTGLSTTAALCSRYETISTDLCRENAKLKHEVKYCNEQIYKLNMEIKELKNESAMSRQHVQGPLSGDMNNLQLNCPVSSNRMNVSHHCSTGVRGIYPIPTATAETVGTTVVNTTTMGLNFSTHLTSTIRTHATSFIHPSNSVNPQVQKTPMYVQQHQMQSNQVPTIQRSQSIPQNVVVSNAQLSQDLSQPQSNEIRMPLDTDNSEQEDNLSLSCEDSSAEVGNSEELSRKGMRLKKAGLALKKMLNPPVNDKLTKHTVQGIHKSLLTAVDAERNSVLKLLDRYETCRSEIPNPDLTCLIEDIIEDARDWSIGMRQKYSELDCGKKSLDSNLFEGLKRFHKDSDINIFEFLKRFETYMEEQGTAKEKAVLLFEKYLSPDIQLEVIDRKENYQLMKKWLLRKFGDVRTITGNILKTMSKEEFPNQSSTATTVTSYYRNLNSVMKKIQELKKTVDMPIDDLNSHIYSNDFISKLLVYVPEKTRLDFMDRLINVGEDPERIQGETAFKTLSTTIFRHFCMTKGNEMVDACNVVKVQRKVSSPKARKSVNAVQADPTEEVDKTENESAYYQSSYRNEDKEKAQKERKKLPFIHPCIVNGHNHEIGECPEFFTLSALARKKKAFKKICYTCLGSFENCKSGCNNVQSVLSKKLSCPECKVWAESNNKNPINILLCSRKAHTKPKNQDLINSLSRYLKKFDANLIQGQITLAGHLQIIAHSGNCTKCNATNCNCQVKSKTSKVNPKARIPTINTYTGKHVTVPKNKIIKDSENDSFYIMQLLSMCNKDVLTFYDRGANKTLIEGELAENLNLKVLSEKPVNIGIVGGDSICTEYGTYAVSIGPTENGEYHTITAQGITAITSAFPKYDLADINRETLQSGLKLSSKLPEYIGGSKAQLLLGINNNALDPEQVFQLPSGLSIFKSQLLDKFGSRYCYGGPHSLFTAVNKKCSNVNHTMAFFMHMVWDYKQSIYPALSYASEERLVEHDSGLLFVAEDKVHVGEELQGTALEDTDEESDLDDVCICSPLDDPKPCTITAYKARLPISKRKEYMDEEDKAFAEGYRCESCSRCKKCLIPSKEKMMSLQGKIEQEAIEKSVDVDLVEKKTYIDLPFIKDPVEALKKKHHGHDNYKQAFRHYQRECKRPENVKDELVKVHKDLVEKGFLMKVSDLSDHKQKIINNAGFQHYMPWTTAEKAGSVSTPYRMVVNASITGINELLAKGETNIARINDILIRNRCTTNVFTTDISKMYNQLHLRDESLPYGLFLFHESLDPNVEPEVYCMLVAWYGVSSSGNQGGEALERIVKSQKDDYPLALEIILNDRYVDDVFSGHNSRTMMETQIEQTKHALENGGFKLKYVVKSGETPCSEASNDGKTVSILGYDWDSKLDLFKPGFKQINFNKKRRGFKQPNPFPVVSKEDVTKVLESKKITRRMVTSKIAELFDPCGFWEPYKLQLKLDRHKLNGLNWDVELDADLQKHWTSRFQQFLDIPTLSIGRCVIPHDAVDPNKIRLLCLADAAESAGGTAIYATVERTDGTYSCSLLTSRSKKLNHSIPRNELEAIKLMAETALDVKHALGDKVVDTLFFTDSTIAMCWCLNTHKKLRMFTLYRVADTRRAIKAVTGLNDDDPLPLYHIDGKLNMADLLTKPNNITPKDIGLNSEWQTGLPWMTLPVNQMPISKYSDLQITIEETNNIDKECFPDPVFLKQGIDVHLVQSTQSNMHNEKHCIGCTPKLIHIPQNICYGRSDDWDHCDDCKCAVKFSVHTLKMGSQHTVDHLIENGWWKTIRQLSTVMKVVATFMHKSHISKGNQISNKCIICQNHEDIHETGKIFRTKAKNFLFRQESTRIKKILPKKKLEGFIEKEGVLYAEGRLLEENPVTQTDLGFEVFFDNTEIKSMLPVVLSGSELFFSYAMFIHNKVRIHSGVESTLREINKTMFVLNNPRRILQRIRKDCPKCRIIAKKTVELKMASHPAARTTIAPPFYHCQMDTVYGFKGQIHKNARKTIKIYALLIVCLLTGATNILSMEGLETQDVLQAMERHSSRYGVPGVVYVDNGTQLVALENAHYNLRDFQLRVHDSLGLNVLVSTAKSHEARGRAEAKVKILRSMLEKLSITADSCMTAVQWETLFSKISNQINDLPIAKGTSTNVNDPGWQIITANRLMLGRNNNRTLEGSFDLSKGSGMSNLLKRNKEIQTLWYQIFIDKLHHLIPRPQKWNKSEPISSGDICLFTHTENAGLGKGFWKIGKVVSVSSKNKVTIKYPGNTFHGKYKLPVLREITRSPRNISIISPVDAVDLNSRNYFEKISSVQKHKNLVLAA